MDTKARPLYMLSTRDPPQNKGHIQPESEGLGKKKKEIHANGDQKKAGVAIHISDKIDFKIKAVKRDKEGHYIMIKGSIQAEDILWNSAFKWYIFPFLLCLACLVFSQLFLRPPQRTILPFCISFSWGWS